MNVDLAVVGAGAGGLSAAETAWAVGLDVVVIDEQADAGRISRPGLRTREPATLESEMHTRPRLSILRNAVAWGVTAERELAVYRGGSTRLIRAGAVVLACGSYDRAVPFPGWSLPGVLSASAALSLVRRHGVRPGRGVLAVGAGSQLQVLARCLLDNGVNLVAVLDSSDQLASALRSRLRSVGVQLLTHHALLRAEGTGGVKRAIAIRVDDSWRPIPGTERTFEVDAVICCFGVVPAVELAQLACCAHVFDRQRGCWTTRHDERMETTVPGLFVVGQTAGVPGAAVAMLEGSLAGLFAAHRLGRITEREARRRAAPLRRRLKRLRSEKAEARGDGAPRDGLLDLLTPDTIVCRCEEVSAEELEDVAQRAGATLRYLKTQTRIAMGRCQGRYCMPTATGVLARRQRLDAATFGPPSIRAPVKPVPLAGLIIED